MVAMSPVATAEYRARLRTLVAAFVACGQELRTIHEQYTAEQGGWESHERREKLRQIFLAELDVLKESQCLHEQIDDLLRILREMRLRSRT